MDLVKKTGCARVNGMEMTTHLLIHAFNLFKMCLLNALLEPDKVQYALDTQLIKGICFISLWKL